MNNVTISGNIAESEGAGVTMGLVSVEDDGEFFVEDCLFFNNSAKGSSAAL